MVHDREPLAHPSPLVPRHAAPAVQPRRAPALSGRADGGATRACTRRAFGAAASSTGRSSRHAHGGRRRRSRRHRRQGDASAQQPPPSRRTCGATSSRPQGARTGARREGILRRTTACCSCSPCAGPDHGRHPLDREEEAGVEQWGVGEDDRHEARLCECLRLGASGARTATGA